MRAILMHTGETDSPRWQKLCGLLGARTPGDQNQVLGHLTRWFLRWAGQPALDSGVWFGVSEVEIGEWAAVEASAACKWGRALIAAGYVGRIQEMYPEPLGRLRKGYVALDGAGGVMLDEVFGARRRLNASTLALYLLDRRARIRAAAAYNVDAKELEGSGQIPPGWLDSSDTGDWRGEGGRLAVSSEQLAVSSGCGAGDRGQGAVVSGQCSVGRGDRVQGVPVAAVERRPVVGFAGSVSGAHTGGPPTPEMLKEVREHKYSDPVRAMRALDDSELSVRKWRLAFERNPDLVREELGKLVETEKRFFVLRLPSAVLMSNLRQLGLLDRG